MVSGNSTPSPSTHTDALLAETTICAEAQARPVTEGKLGVLMATFQETLLKRLDVAVASVVSLHTVHSITPASVVTIAAGGPSSHQVYYAWSDQSTHPIPESFEVPHTVMVCVQTTACKLNTTDCMHQTMQLTNPTYHIYTNTY